MKLTFEVCFVKLPITLGKERKMLELMFRIEEELDKVWPLGMLTYLLSPLAGAILSFGLVSRLWTTADLAYMIHDQWSLVIFGIFWIPVVLIFTYGVLISYIFNTDRVYQDMYSNPGLFGVGQGFLAPIIMVIVIGLVVASILSNNSSDLSTA